MTELKENAQKLPQRVKEWLEEEDIPYQVRLKSYNDHEDIIQHFVIEFPPRSQNFINLLFFARSNIQKYEGIGFNQETKIEEQLKVVMEKTPWFDTHDFHYGSGLSIRSTTKHIRYSYNITENDVMESFRLDLFIPVRTRGKKSYPSFQKDRFIRVLRIFHKAKFTLLEVIEKRLMDIER